MSLTGLTALAHQSRENAKPTNGPSCTSIVKHLSGRQGAIVLGELCTVSKPTSSVPGSKRETGF
jgi:hypothetical protein